MHSSSFESEFRSINVRLDADKMNLHSADNRRERRNIVHNKQHVQTSEQRVPRVLQHHSQLDDYCSNLRPIRDSCELLREPFAFGDFPVSIIRRDVEYAGLNAGMTLTNV